ncbi:AraC family transcriptional regulator [Achromobacter aloeverae]|uniref:AraC family transcriptional regulator n=1 Tax=Achromobacter aloeverae TaxID=1750518 RepID=A0A4Q1HLM9_9BURK|nr:AraC family transcriptional regulator [Achromobacter aloeverae]RXN91373.1 AraC family transcriptional regulator [Achromobacter aloeverae]
MDALSDVLSTLRVGSVLSTRFEGRGDWALRFPAYKHVKFGGVLSGTSYLGLEGGEPVLLEEGDFYLLTDGRPFCSASDPSCAPEDGVAVVHGKRGEDGVTRHYCDGAGAPVSLASGRFTFENEVGDVLLRHLPPLIHLRAADIGSTALGHVLGLLRLESSGLHLGGEVARGSLASLALVHVLRAHLDTTPQPQGWLGALSDARVGKALSAMHAEPGRRWTVDSLASTAAMSRTAFANRFRDRVGVAPLSYLNQWRMTLARTALRDSDQPLADIAAKVGYLSDTAFSIAFKRSTGMSPGRFRVSAGR